jgi:hypothetical protein
VRIGCGVEHHELLAGLHAGCTGGSSRRAGQDRELADGGKRSAHERDRAMACHYTPGRRALATC